MKKLILFIALILSCWVLSAWADNKTPLKTEPAPVKEISQSATAPTAFQLPWSSINGGGDVTMSSTNYKAKVTTGQSVIGESQSTNYQMGIGFWYGAGLYCLGRPGEVNGITPITSADVVYLVKYVFDQDRPATACVDPDPGTCWPINPLCAGEVNGIPPITSADIVYLVKYVFDLDRPATSCIDPDPGTCWPLVPTESCCLP